MQGIDGSYSPSPLMCPWLYAMEVGGWLLGICMHTRLLHCGSVIVLLPSALCLSGETW